MLDGSTLPPLVDLAQPRWPAAADTLVECPTHPVGSSHLVPAHAVIHEVDRLDEISAVPRPRDPLARYDAVEIPAQQVATLPGSNDPNAVLECKRCIRPCIGFTAAEEALGFA
jgi:hypothetical protein